jgi:multicomponent Na+:H+ antiporter subunit D
MDTASFIPLIPIIAAGLAGVLIFVNGDKAFWRNLWSTIASIVAFLAVLSMVPGTLAGKVYVAHVLNLLDLTLTLRVDYLGLLFGLVASAMWVVVNVYTIGYMDHEHEKQRFFAFFGLSMFAAFGIAFAENLFTLFIFYELLSLCTYPLVTHAGTKEAFKAGAKYLIYTLGGGGFLLAGIMITYFVTGDLSLSGRGIFTINHGAGLLTVVFFLYLIGFGVKAAIMPMHHWLPRAMVAPTPVSTLLHAVAVVKAGAFGVLRLIYNVFGVDLLGELGLGLVLAYMAGFTILTASIIAIRQDNLKRRLAYSTISQLSYIVLGGALLAPAAAIGAMTHIANHAFTKGTLFMCAGIIAEETGKKNISQLNGMGRRLPLTMAAFSIAAFGMIGFPPLAGFMTKWYLGIGAGEINQPLFMWVLVGSSILNSIYFLPIIYRAFFLPPDAGEEKALALPKNRFETAPTMLVPIMTTTVASVVLGLFAGAPGLPMSVAKLATSFLVGGQ